MIEGCSFIDTNVLVYAHDASEPERQRTAQDLITKHVSSKSGIVSAQVLSECYVVLRRKGFSAEEAREIVERYKSLFLVLPISAADVSAAMTGVEVRVLSYWDALVWATAKSHGVTTILSEDGPTGANLDGVTFVNPFQRTEQTD